MQKQIPNIVITPDNYASGNSSYPVLYLLHGAGGNYKSWISAVPEIRKYANIYEMIIVCPNAENSWYLDSPVDESMRYETYASKELVEAIDQKYRTISTVGGRAITGLSMGGHGAFYLALRHQDIWGAAGSMSGGLDFRPFPNNWDLPKRLGSREAYRSNWENNTVVNMTGYLMNSKLKLIFDCGVDDFFYEGNKQMHQLLLQQHYPHDYTERPGKHNWNYWSNSIKYQMVFFDDYFHQSEP